MSAQSWVIAGRAVLKRSRRHCYGNLSGLKSGRLTSPDWLVNESSMLSLNYSRANRTALRKTDIFGAVIVVSDT
jgi:hypothetical protein